MNDDNDDIGWLETMDVTGEEMSLLHVYLPAVEVRKTPSPYSPTGPGWLLIAGRKSSTAARGLRASLRLAGVHPGSSRNVDTILINDDA